MTTTQWDKIVAAGLLALCGVGACAGEQAAQSGPGPAVAGPIEVGVVTLHRQKVALQRELPGRTAPVLVAEVRPQVGGIVQKRLFEEGQDVEEGQVLYELDAGPFAAAAAQAKAALASAEAIVASAKARAGRYSELVEMEAVAAQDADDAKAAYAQAVADVAQQRAALRTAQINLEYTKIRAPIAGRIGISDVTAGALVTAGQSEPLATIRNLERIYVDVSQSSAEMLRLRRQLQGDEGVSMGGTSVQLTLEDGSSYGHEGVLKLREVAVNESTGTVTLRAEFPNPEGILVPGMYVRASLTEATLEHAILAPQASIARQSDGQATAFVVPEDNKVEQRPVTTGRAVGRQWLILDGLHDGERIVVEGTSKVRPGQAVRPMAVNAVRDDAPRAAVDDGHSRSVE